MCYICYTLVAYLFTCAVLEYERDFHSVYAETSGVVQWFALGSLLQVPCNELDRINADYRFSHEGLVHVLSAWLKNGAATWFSLVRALRKMGQNDLASKIAMKKRCGCANFVEIPAIIAY